MIINPAHPLPPVVNTPAPPPTSDETVLNEPLTHSMDIARGAITALTTTRAGRRHLAAALETLNTTT